MTRIWDYFDPDVGRGLPGVDTNPLLEKDVLDETQIVRLQFDAVRSRLGILLEMRTALHEFGDQNVATLLFDGVTRFDWSGEQRTTHRTAWTVLGSTPARDGKQVGITLSLSPDGRCTVKSRSARFVLGSVWSLEFIPDYGEDADDVVDRNLADWDSEFVALSSSQLP